VDLERHALVDLLPDRTADSLVEWLQGHPGSKILSRDRAEAYADGAGRGAPTARSVADRWHLLKNVGEALERVVLRHHRALSEVARRLRAATPVSPATGPDAPDPKPPRPPTRAQREQALC